MNSVFSGTLSPLLSTIILILSIVFSLVACFFGYKLLKIWTILIGFVLGLVIGGVLTYYFSKQNLLLTIIIALIVGIVLGILAFALYKVGVFILAAYEGYLIVTNVISALWPSGSHIIVTIIAVIIAIAVGILAVRFIRPVIIIETALSGGASIASLLIQHQIFQNPLIPLGIFVVIAVAGIITQFSTTHEDDHIR